VSARTVSIGDFASVRTVWRLMADPKSGFPQPRRLRGRTLLARDEVLAFVRGSEEPAGKRPRP